VEGLVWIEGRDEAEYRAGRVFDGARYVSLDQAPASDVGARQAFHLRTDHVALRTNLSWARALEVARTAEGHVKELVGGYGERLGLRLPDGPLRMVVTARRREFNEILRGRTPDGPGWGAFYDARDGVVYLSLEAAPRGALPWRADLRHEMTHQILDLSRPEPRRAQPFPVPWFWLWEGIAIWSETLGDPPGVDSGKQRLVRFRKRYAGNDWTPLKALVELPPARFEGRHYDETASLMRALLDPALPARRAAIVDLGRGLLRGPLPRAALLQALGESLAGFEARWLNSVGR